METQEIKKRQRYVQIAVLPLVLYLILVPKVFEISTTLNYVVLGSIFANEIFWMYKAHQIEKYKKTTLIVGLISIVILIAMGLYSYFSV